MPTSAIILFTMIEPQLIVGNVNENQNQNDNENLQQIRDRSDAPTIIVMVLCLFIIWITNILEECHENNY